MFDFKLPDLGEGVAEGQVVSLFVKEGDTIEEYAPMMEVETDKAAVEIPSPKTGTIAKVHVEEGQTVQVGAVMITIDTGAGSGEASSAPAEESKSTKASTPTAKSSSSSESAPPASTATAPPPAAAAPSPGGNGHTGEAASTSVARTGPIPAAPAVRKLARELNVDLATVAATGPRGRVLREDVERASRGEGGAVMPAGGAAISITTADLPDFSQYGPIRREPAPQIRKTIAKQMAIAWHSVPRVTASDSADVTEIDASRKQYNAALKEGDTKLTMTAIICKAVAATLRKHPKLNCSYDGQRDEIVYKDYVNLGIAVDTPRGLIVPVLRECDRKPLPELAGELNDLVARVRSGKFDISELRGGTFTITNLGPLGGEYFSPMVNFPEVAILGIGSARKKPWVINDEIVPRLILPLSLSYDHRIVDGADGARFSTDLIRGLENPLQLISLL